MSLSLESHCLSFREIPQTTKLFSAFLEEFDRVASYYAHPPTEAGLGAAASEVELSPEVRQSVAEILREQNRRFGVDAATERNIDRLAAGAVAIVTGQQVGIFSGPAYSFYKAISAAGCAREATSRGVEAVPIFWLATEDHDIAEVDHSYWNTRSGLARYELPRREEDAGRRVGEVVFGEAIEPLVTRASASLEGGYAHIVDRALRESYGPRETYGSAFGKLMARLLAGRGIIFIDPLDRRLHQLAAPIYRRALEDADSLREALLARSDELDRSGLHAQVKVTRETTLVFYNLDGKRRALRSRNGKFLAGKASFSGEELVSALERSPEDFTPNVLLRPIVQDTLLPTAAYIGGSAEIAYTAQAQVVYEKLLGRMPVILPRASFTIIEAPIARLLLKYGLDIRDFFLGRQHLRRKMERKSLPSALGRRFERDEKVFRRLLTGYEHPFEDLDRTLIGALRLAERKMLYQFAKLKAKAGRAEGVRTGDLDRHERILVDSVYPHRGLQERSLCALPFLAAYGLELLDDLARRSSTYAASEASSCGYRHHILVL
jgi:bacillithiol biosynthesis cysteine-adding enzyme BshC